MRKSVKRLDVSLAVLFVTSLALIINGHEDPFVRETLCSSTGFCLYSDHASFWNKLAYDAGMGALVSLIFYGLLVRIPEEQMRRRMKQSLKSHYEIFKRDCISIFLGAANGSYSADHVDNLLDQSTFRDYFTRDPVTRKSKWDDVLNNLNEQNLRELATSIEVFRDEISYVLNNTDINSDEAFAFFKRLSRVINSTKSTTLDYDSIKSLAGFYWTIFAGWDPVSGYRDNDIVEDMILDI